MIDVKPGKYKHFKGNIYEVIGVAKHSETEEEFVVYSGNGQLWIRPKKMFLEDVVKDGKKIPRFDFIGKK